jgi:hypothetical protein
MQYLKVHWKHEHPDEPVLLYSELDDERYEVRKVDVFRDGALGYADNSQSHGKGTILAAVPIPSITEIGSNPEFRASTITRDEFETMWRKAFHHERE